jgi:PAS domain S-box-containing protein
MLVATSTLDLTYTTENKRIGSWESENPKINQTSKSISEQFGDFGRIDEKQRLSIHVLGEKYFVQLSPLTDHRGIDWLILVLVPENDFMSHIKAGNFNTLLLSVLALGMTVVVGFMIARRITSPIEELNIAARSLADGDWSVELKIDRRDEVGELARSFNLMVKNLQAATVSRDRLAEEIEERKKIESELQRLAAVVEHSSEIVNLADLDGKMVFLNEVGGVMLGIPPRDVENHSIMEVIPDELKSRVEHEVLPTLLKEGRWVGELQYRNLITGALFDVHAMTFTIHSADGEPLYLANVSLDITERKRAEEARRDSEEQYHHLYENLRDGIAAVDLNGRIINCNTRFLNMLGYSFEELARLAYADITPESWHAVEASILKDQVDARGYSDLYEKEYIRKDGTIFPIELQTYLLSNINGDPVGYWAFVRDISDLKRAEEEKRRLEDRLQRAEKMEALGTMAGGVAHDLNNVLGVVVGYAELLLRDVDKSSSIRPKLLNILSGGQRAAAIVEDLLTLARRGVPGKEVLNLNSIIVDFQQSPEFEKLSCHNSLVRIKAEFGEDLLNISGSSVHLAKTLFNLVSNAVEAMPNGGILTIKTANQYLDKPIRGYDEVREGDYVVLSVSDTGEGIPANDLKRIFEPFYTKKVMGRSGTGLGLAVVWGTAKDHKGYINVQSEEGKGSIFTLYFPVTREEISTEHIAVSISEYMGKGESILIVDDVDAQRDLAADMLRKLNYSVASVSSGEDAVEYIRNQTVDLVVLDMIMDPGMDGLDTYREMLEIHPQQKAIIVSGFSETERVSKAQALGAGSYVKKPYVLEKLGMAVKKELDRSG